MRHPSFVREQEAPVQERAADITWGMQLPVNPPVLPMLAKRVGELPVGKTWIFEPKWDGFRALVFRDGDEILIQSRDEKSLNRYFPELLEPLRAQLPARCVLDGEIVIANNNGLDFEALQLRIHPAASRVKLLSQANAGVDCLLRFALRWRPGFARRAIRRPARGDWNRCFPSAAPPLHLTPATHDRMSRRIGFSRFEGAGLDGVMAKPAAGTYEPDKRVMLKVKHERDCDCVVAGFRWHKKASAPRSARCCWGSSTIPARCNTSASAPASRMEKRRELVEFLAPYRENALAIIPGSDGRSGSNGGSRPSHAGRTKPLEPGQRPVLGAVAAGVGGRGRIRAHARQPLPSHGAVSQMAHGQKAQRLHLCPARSGSTARADGDLRRSR